jgi:hypothetical protein
MSVLAFCRILRSRWDHCTRILWPETPHERAQSELGHLDEELRRRHVRLLQCRQKIEKLRDNLDRRSTDRLRARLQERERAYDRQLERFQKLKRVRAELQDQVLSASRSRQTTNREEEDDFGYPF